MDEFLVVCGSILVGIALLCGVGAYNNNKDNAAMLEMINKGAHPIEARCVVKPRQNDVECVLYTATKKVQP
jgi:hypothetical protein